MVFPCGHVRCVSMGDVQRARCSIALFSCRWIGRDADTGRAVWVDLETDDVSDHLPDYADRNIGLRIVSPESRGTAYRESRLFLMSRTRVELRKDVFISSASSCASSVSMIFNARSQAARAS